MEAARQRLAQEASAVDEERKEALAEATEAPNFAEFEFDFLKDRTLALTETQVVSAANASLMFSGLVGQTLQMILQSSAPQQP